MKGYFVIPTAAAGFFLSAWIGMIFWGILGPDFGLGTIGYAKSMLVTIALWLVVAPLAAAGAGGDKKKK
ncbi:MAG: hypothetical protein FJ317_05890 [SAR202 cluster bacterium]|nr:hypothetical protein [SAR202 cluster bacterium]